MGRINTELHARTLYDKLWDEHVVHLEEDGTAVLYIDRHLIHEVTSPQAFEGLRQAGRKPNPDFVLNQARYQGASILLARKNFGCGSSREHAPWALEQFVFRALIVPRYADIFFNNSFKNGLLPIVLAAPQLSQLFDEALAFPGYALTIDLERQVIVKPGGAELAFEVQPFRKYCLLNGFDDIGLTLRHSDKIKTFEAQRLAEKQWLAHTLLV